MAGNVDRFSFHPNNDICILPEITRDALLTFSRCVDHRYFSFFLRMHHHIWLFIPLLIHAVYIITFDPLPNFSDTTLVNVRRWVSVKQTSITCLYECIVIVFLQLSGNFSHKENSIEQTWDFPYLVRTECGSAPVRIFKSNVFSMVNGKILTAQCALL